MDFVAQLKSSVDIVQVIQEYVRLRKVGPRYVGLCPFHNEKTPSFSVNSSHQFYKCFGCGAGGDVLKFVMELERLSFYEALKLLAEKHGIPMPKRSEYSDPETKLRAAIYQMNELAVEAFRANLEGAAGTEARAYLERRGVASAVAEEFGLGYAERSGRGLVRLFEKHNFSSEQMEESGLVGKRDDGSFYDRFRHRLMFPIHNESGKVDRIRRARARSRRAGEISEFAGNRRSITRATFSTICTAPSTASGSPTGWCWWKATWTRSASTAAGVHEVVASCGTSLTSQQVQTMKRHAGKIVVNFDPDHGGRQRDRALHQHAAGRRHARPHPRAGWRPRSR